MQTNLADYLKQMSKTIDGIAWHGVCLLTIVCLGDLWFGVNAVPLRESHDPGKASVLLAFSPLIVFLCLLQMRLLPFASNRSASWMRAGLCVAIFLVLNF